jgi:hypothetical protein
MSGMPRSQSSENVSRRQSKKSSGAFDKVRKLNKGDFTNDEESNYDSFLRKYKIDPEHHENTTQQDSVQINQALNYSNLIQQKAEHNISFSNNLVEPEGESSSDGEGVMDLQELDLNYDDNARKDYEVEQSQRSQYSHKEQYDYDVHLNERGKF